MPRQDRHRPAVEGKAREAEHGGHGGFGGRERAGEPADRSLAAPRDVVMHAHSDLRRLRHQFGRLGSAKADRRVASPAAGFHDGFPLVEHRHPGRRVVGRADWRSRRPQAPLGREFVDLRPGLDRQCARAVAARIDRRAFFHRAWHRRRVSRRGEPRRGLRAAPAARLVDHGELYRGAGWWVCRRPARLAMAAAAIRLGVDFCRRRPLPVDPGADPPGLAAGVPHAFSPASKPCPPATRRCSTNSASPKASGTRSTSPTRIRSSCCSAKAIFCRPCLCG